MLYWLLHMFFLRKIILFSRDRLLRFRDAVIPRKRYRYRHTRIRTCGNRDVAQVDIPSRAVM